MSTATDRSPESPTTMRAVLSREGIVREAVALVDEHGPDALTMRAVAKRLSAGAMSLYRHVSSRDELLDLVLEAMAAEVTPPTPTGDWRRDLADLAREVRAGLLRRPHLTVLLTSRAGRGTAELPLLEHTIGILRGAGLSACDAVLANHAVGNLIAGAALWEAVGLSGAAGPERAVRRQDAQRVIAELPAGRYPNLEWAGDEITAASLDERFEFALALLLDGIEHRLT
jgi:AcrR family transcriptional regulator